MPLYWEGKRNHAVGSSGFFRVALCHNSLSAMYQMNFAMMQHHNYSLTEIENMMPWEREIYVAMLQQWIRDENERIEAQNRKYK